MESKPEAEEAAFTAQLAALKSHFRAGLPARRAALAGAWRGCREGSDATAWQALREVAHKLAGSAPCYGLDTLGEAARELDRLLSGRVPCRDAAQAAPHAEHLIAELDRAIAG